MPAGSPVPQEGAGGFAGAARWRRESWMVPAGSPVPQEGACEVSGTAGRMSRCRRCRVVLPVLRESQEDGGGSKRA